MNKQKLPAFPYTSGDYPGMTLRDYFAANAMQGLCADPNTSVPFKEIAEWSYNMADAMLEARE